jgi:hypothetical protein
MVDKRTIVAKAFDDWATGTGYVSSRGCTTPAGPEPAAKMNRQARRAGRPPAPPVSPQAGRLAGPSATVWKIRGGPLSRKHRRAPPRWLC